MELPTGSFETGGKHREEVVHVDAENQCTCAKQQTSAKNGGGPNPWVQTAAAILKMAAVVISTWLS